MTSVGDAYYSGQWLGNKRHGRGRVDRPGLGSCDGWGGLPVVGPGGHRDGPLHLPLSPWGLMPSTRRNHVF